MSIIRLVLFTLSCMLILSCKRENITIEQLEGEWISYENPDFIFSFERDRCSYFFSNNFAKYRIRENDIIINDTFRTPVDTTVQCVQLHIERLTADELILVTDTNFLKKEFANSIDELDTFRLKMMKERYDNGFSFLKFESSQCFGTCPQIKLEIDKNGKFRYEGIAYTEKNGYYSGTLSPQQYATLQRKLNYLNLDSLQSNYAAYWTDDQGFGLTLHTMDTIYKTNVYGFYKEPIELRILINELMNVYKQNTMRLDSLHESYDDDIFY